MSTDTSFEAILGLLGKKLDEVTFIKVGPIEEQPTSPTEDPYKGVTILPFVTSNEAYRTNLLIGFINISDKEKSPIFIVTFRDGKKRAYRQTSTGALLSVGKNIYSNTKTVVVDKSADWSLEVIDAATSDGGLAPDPFAAKL